MANVINSVNGGFNSTANVDTYTKAFTAFGLTPGDLWIVYVASTGTVAADATLTATANLTFSLIGTATKNGGQDKLYCFIADQLMPSSPAAMTISFNCPSDPATGSIMSFAIAQGMSRSGLSAIRQYAANSEIASGVAPSATFASSCLTANPTLIGSLTSVAGSTPPSGWTEQVDATYGGPTTGGGYASRDSGFTGTTITFGTTAQGLNCAFAIELDTSVPPKQGSASGTVAWSGAAIGGTPAQGSSTGSVAWSGSATGKRVPKGTSTGATAWSGSAAGARNPKGDASGSAAWSGSAEGKSDPQGVATGATDWIGEAEGASPELPASGSAEGSISWVGEVGHRVPDAPPYRTVVIGPEFRTITVLHENRTVEIAGESRIVVVNS